MTIHSNILVWRIPWTERGLVGCNPWGCKESDVIEWLILSLSYIKELITALSPFRIGLNPRCDIVIYNKKGIVCLHPFLWHGVPKTLEISYVIRTKRVKRTYFVVHKKYNFQPCLILCWWNYFWKALGSPTDGGWFLGKPTLWWKDWSFQPNPLATLKLWGGERCWNHPWALI